MPVKSAGLERRDFSADKSCRRFEFFYCRDGRASHAPPVQTGRSVELFRSSSRSAICSSTRAVCVRNEPALLTPSPCNLMPKMGAPIVASPGGQDGEPVAVVLHPVWLQPEARDQHEAADESGDEQGVAEHLQLLVQPLGLVCVGQEGHLRTKLPCRRISPVRAAPWTVRCVPKDTRRRATQRRRNHAPQRPEFASVLPGPAKPRL